MPVPHFRIRTLMIAVASLAAGLAISPPLHVRDADYHGADFPIEMKLMMVAANSLLVFNFTMVLWLGISGAWAFCRRRLSIAGDSRPRKV